MAKILIDSGIFVALFDKSDKYHLSAVQFIKDNKKPLITSLACITEAMFLLAHPRPQNTLLNWLHLARIEIAEFTHQDMPALADLMSQYTTFRWILLMAVWCIWHSVNGSKPHCYH